MNNNIFDIIKMLSTFNQPQQNNSNNNPANNYYPNEASQNQNINEKLENKFCSMYFTKTL